MTQAIIFDCFGVLTNDGWRQLREQYFKGDAALMQRALDIDAAVNGGFMNYDEFIHEISDMTGLDAAEVKQRIAKNVPNEQLFEYIKSGLKPRFKIGLLSNAADDWLDTLFKPWQRELFDGIALSYEAGMVKPDPAIYELAAFRLGVSMDECIFIDDIERYATAARDLGMKAVVHQDNDETIRAIEEYIDA